MIRGAAVVCRSKGKPLIGVGILPSPESADDKTRELGSAELAPAAELFNQGQTLRIELEPDAIARGNACGI